MEPMTLGSPTGSPVSNVNAFLPSFLMGEPNVQTTPRTNTLSPTKGRTLAFAQSPNVHNSSNDFNRSFLQNKHITNTYQQNSPANTQNFPLNSIGTGSSGGGNGPPTQCLFDSLRKGTMDSPLNHNSHNGLNQLHNRSLVNHNINGTGGDGIGGGVTNGYGLNQSIHFNQSINDSYLSQTDYNSPRITSPISSVRHNPYEYNSRLNQSLLNMSNNEYLSINNQQHHNQNNNSMIRQSNFWITVFGFPQSATSMILSHFSQCGTIVDKIFPSQNGNWIHLKFSSRLECDKALNYHERIIGTSLMIGVTYCKDPNILEQENIEENHCLPVNRVRPLTHVAYKNAQNSTEVAPNTPAPKLSSGIVNKAMDLIFGW